jgi:hypothetical protein
MLDWIALAILIAIFGLVIFGLVAVWGVPYDIAKVRNHPHQDAIGAATIVSIFTLGALWPLLWVWAMTSGRTGVGDLGLEPHTLA